LRKNANQPPPGILILDKWKKENLR